MLSSWIHSQGLSLLSAVPAGSFHPLLVHRITDVQSSRRPRVFSLDGPEPWTFQGRPQFHDGHRDLNFTVNPRKLPSHAFYTRPCPRPWRVNAKAVTINCDVRSTAQRPMRNRHSQEPGNTRLIEYVCALQRVTHRPGQHLHPPTGFLRIKSLKRIQNKPLSALSSFPFLCTYESFLTVISFAAFTRTSFIATPHIVSNAGAGFRKTNGLSYRKLLDSSHSVLTLIPSSNQPVPIFC